MNEAWTSIFCVGAVLLLLFGLLFFVREDYAEIKAKRTIQKLTEKPENFRYQEWNGHRYVIWGYHGGITHDPDCPYDKKEIEK